MKYTLHKKSKIAFEQVGKGDTIVLLHGFCEDSTMWADFIPLLSKKYSFLTIDLSGFGQSDLLEEHTLAEMAESVHTVLTNLYIDSCILIGHSMGGYVGLEFAKKYPSKLLGLGLFHSHPFTDNAEKTKNRLKTIRFIERHGVAPFAGQFVRNLFASAFVKTNSTFIEELVHKTSTHHSDAVIAASHAMISRTDQTETLVNCPCPVLFIVGKQDNAISYENSLKQLSLPTISSIHIFEKVGHMGMFEIPENCATIINEFIAFCVE